MNSKRPRFPGQKATTHSEGMAIANLPFNRGKEITVDVMILRVSPNGLKESHPCKNCAKELANIKGYRVRNVYYSNSDGEIVKDKLEKILSRAVKSRGHHIIASRGGSCINRKYNCHLNYFPTYVSDSDSETISVTPSYLSDSD